MVLSSDPPLQDARSSISRRSSASSISVNRSQRNTESVRSGYILPEGQNPTEPWHEKLISRFQFCGCVCLNRSMRDVAFTPQEEEFFGDLRGHLDEPYDMKNPEHEMLLTKIWENTFPNDPLPEPVDPHWTKLGFQSANPRTDIRTGVHSLRSMEYMSRVYSDEFRAIVRESSHRATEYPFAASCVSVAFAVVIFFRLNKRTSVNPSGTQSGNGLALKQFVRLSMENKDTVHEIFTHVALRVHKEWMKQEMGKFDIHYFAVALSTGVEAMKEVFNKKRIVDLSDLRRYISGDDAPSIKPVSESLL
jgi:hypothetical protein